MQQELTPERITALALANGFKLKTQPDGADALNPYVLDFARAVIAADRALRPAGDASMPQVGVHAYQVTVLQADAQAALAAKDREISILNAQLINVKAIASGNLELLDTVTAKDAEIAALRQALQEIRALEHTESDEWDAVERVIPEMVGIACAAIAQAVQPTKGST